MKTPMTPLTVSGIQVTREPHLLGAAIDTFNEFRSVHAPDIVHVCTIVKTGTRAPSLPSAVPADSTRDRYRAVEADA